ncbi:MAG: hypothetical protein QXP36_07240 [Conexivisphaerales archaeon]
MLQTEAKVHEEIKKKLEELGWENGHEILKFKENDLIPEFYFSEILEKKVLINDITNCHEDHLTTNLC